MPATSWLREFAGLGASLAASLAGWVFLAPLAWLVPKRRDWIAVIGRQHGKFVDNAKYFYVQANELAPELRIVFITERADVASLLATHGAPVLRYPSLHAVRFLLRCGSAVVDSTDWERHSRRFLLLRARVIELWHGVGFKRIELDKWRHETGRYRGFSRPWVFQLRLALYHFNGRVVRYAAVACTSQFYRDQVFAPAFLARRFPVTGYPRNAFALSARLPLAALNVDATIARQLPAWAAAGRRVVLVTPTTRDSSATPLQLDAATVRALDAFAAEHTVEFVFKFHPSERRAGHVAGEHLHLCSPDSDIYPLLPQASALVTDYSSIYMDFLLVDRPVLFLIPDGDTYMRADREVQFDPAGMMPGPVVASWGQLLAALAAQWIEDTYHAERAALRRKAFDDLPQDQATPKLLDLMHEERWLP